MAEQIARGATTGTDLIYSPDDGGYYFEQFALLPGKTRVSVDLFLSSDDAKDALRNKRVKWEPWS